MIVALSLVLLSCDMDGDGFGASDCDDGDAEVFPGAPETCNEHVYVLPFHAFPTTSKSLKLCRSMTVLGNM